MRDFLKHAVLSRSVPGGMAPLRTNRDGVPQIPRVVAPAGASAPPASWAQSGPFVDETKWRTQGPFIDERAVRPSPQDPAIKQLGSLFMNNMSLKHGAEDALRTYGLA